MSTTEVLTVGVPGPQGPPGVILVGAWDPDVTYAKGEGVLYADSTYIAKRATTGDVPPDSPLDWQLFAQGSAAAGLAAAQEAIDDFKADTAALVDLPAAGAITGAELALLSQAGVDVKATLNAIITALVKAGLTFTGEIAVDLGAAGVFRVKSVAGLITGGIYANSADAQPILSLGSLLGAPLLGFGQGGATAPDTYWQRSAAGEMTLAGIGATAVLTAPISRKPLAVSTNRNCALTDLGKMIEVNQTALRTQTILPVSSVAWPVGVYLRIRKIGTGDVGLAFTAPATYQDPDGLGLTITTRYETRVLHHHATDEWIMTKGNG